MSAAPKRIQRKRVKGWRMPEGAVYVGRPTRWGNPFTAGAVGGAEAVDLFDDLFRGFWNPCKLSNLPDDLFDDLYLMRCEWLRRLGHGHPTDIARSVLVGHDLACWCPLDEPCHADVLILVANPELSRSEERSDVG